MHYQAARLVRDRICTCAITRWLQPERKPAATVTLAHMCAFSLARPRAPARPPSPRTAHGAPPRTSVYMRRCVDASMQPDNCRARDQPRGDSVAGMRV